jgi:hypothetical protein
VFVVLIDHINATRAAAALLGDDDEPDALEHLAGILDGPTEQSVSQRRAQIAAVSMVLGGD